MKAQRFAVAVPGPGYDVNAKIKKSRKSRRHAHLATLIVRRLFIFRILSVCFVDIVLRLGKVEETRRQVIVRWHSRLRIDDRVVKSWYGDVDKT